jgi:hypothetical protein
MRVISCVCHGATACRQGSRCCGPHPRCCCRGFRWCCSLAGQCVDFIMLSQCMCCCGMVLRPAPSCARADTGSIASRASRYASRPAVVIFVCGLCCFRAQSSSSSRVSGAQWHARTTILLLQATICEVCKQPYVKWPNNPRHPLSTQYLQAWCVPPPPQLCAAALATAMRAKCQRSGVDRVCAGLHVSGHEGQSGTVSV